MKSRVNRILKILVVVLEAIIALFILFNFAIRHRVFKHAQATVMYNMRWYKSAGNIWGKYAGRDDGDYIPESSMGKVEYKQGNYPKAEEGFSSANKERKNRSGVLYDLGNALYRENKLDQALKEYRSAMILDPKDQDVKKNYELVLMRKGYKPPPKPKNGDGQTPGQPEQKKRDNKQDQDKSNSGQQDKQTQNKDKADQDQKMQENQREQDKNTLNALDQNEAYDRMVHKKPSKNGKGGKWW
jgi:Ca-activated chloride channel homolog